MPIVVSRKIDSNPHSSSSSSNQIMLSIPSNASEFLQQKDALMKRKQTEFIEKCFTTFLTITQKLIDKIFDENRLEEELTEITSFTNTEFEHAKNNSNFILLTQKLHDNGFIFDFSAISSKFEIIELKYYQKYNTMEIKQIHLYGTRDDECTDEDDDENCVMIMKST